MTLSNVEGAMHSDSLRSARDRKASIVIQAAALGLAVIIALIAARTAIVALPLIALGFLPLLRDGRLDLSPSTWWTAEVSAFLVLLLYLTINAAWANTPSAAYTKVATVAVMFVATVVAVRGVDGLGAQRGRLGAAFALAATLGAVIVAIQVLSGQAFLRLVLQTYSRAQPDFQFQVMGADLNRNVCMVALVLWPAILAIGCLRRPRRHLFPLMILIVSAMIAVVLSQSLTAVVALPASLAVFLLVRRWPSIGRWSVTLIWIAAFVFVIPVVNWAYDHGFQSTRWLPFSAQERVVIWQSTAQAINRAPLLGIGIRSHRMEAVRRRTQQPDASEAATGWHAHNIFLQSLYELGLIGTVLFAGFGLALLRRLAMLPADVQPYAYAQFAVFLPVAAFAWDMWQGWLIAAIGFNVVCMAVAARARDSMMPAGADRPI